jgi:hypothetical protein
MSAIAQISVHPGTIPQIQHISPELGQSRILNASCRHRQLAFVLFLGHGHQRFYIAA